MQGAILRKCVVNAAQQLPHKFKLNLCKTDWIIRHVWVGKGQLFLQHSSIARIASQWLISKGFIKNLEKKGFIRGFLDILPTGGICICLQSFKELNCKCLVLELICSLNHFNLLYSC